MRDFKDVVRRTLVRRNLPAARETEIVEELSEHLEDRYRELRARGTPEDRADREVLAELDATDLTAYVARLPSAPGPVPIGGGSRASIAGGLLQDLRFGARLIARERGAACVVVATLSLAIAANTIVFAFADLLLLRPLPLANIDRLVAVYSIQAQNTDRQPDSIPDFVDMRSATQTLERMSAMTRQPVSMTGAGEPRAINAAYVTANHFRVWGVSTVLGRGFLDGEDAHGHEGVAVLSHHFWKTQFNGAESAIREAVTLNGRSYAVVGVLTPAIEIGNISQTDVWVPLEIDASARRDELSLAVFALRKPSASLEATQAEFRALAEGLQKEHPATNAGRQYRVLSGRDATVGGSTWIILALLAVVVGLVLVVACANVATVVLSRASARHQEIAVRIALGATRARLVRQFVVENLLLGIASGAVGLLLAYGGLSAFKALSTESYFQFLQINANLLAFVVALSIAAPVVFGVGPALQASKPDLNEDLKGGGRDGAASVRGGRSRSILVVAQVAFALAVLVASGLIVRSVVALEHVPLGLDAADMLTMRVRFDPPGYTADAQRFRTIESILDRLSAAPGVAAASASRHLPIIDGEPSRRFAIAGQPLPEAKDLPWAFEAAVAGEYARAAGVGLLDGRLWRPEDRASGWGVAVVNREAARRYWPARSPIGEHVTMTDADGRPTGDPLTIVGVIDNVIAAPEAPPPPRIYRPLAVRPMASVVFLIRTAGDPGVAGPALRSAVREENRDLAVSDLRPFSDQIASELRTQNLIMAMFAAFAAIGFVVAIAGIYGVTAFAVTQRRREISVRLALGASAAGMARLVMGRSLRLIVIGAALGLGGAAALGSAMRSVLFGVPATDPLTYAIVVAVFTIGGLTATYVPARRVTSFDPAAVLKRE